jgi:hypothetical protein
MNWARRLRWRAAVPALAALAAVTAAALPAAAQAAGPPRPGAGPTVPVFKTITWRAAGTAAAQAPVLPLAGATPAVAATGDPAAPFVFAYTGSDNHAYEAPLASPASAESLGGTLVGGPGLAFVPASIGGPGVTGPWVRGADNALWGFKGFTSGGSPRWQSLGGGLTSRPGVAAGVLSSVFGGSGPSVNAVIRGYNGALWDRNVLVGNGLWYGYGLGGVTLAGSGPAAVNVGGTLYVLAIRPDGSVWVNSNSTSDGAWSGWKSLGGRASGDVGVASPAPGVGVVFVRGLDNAVWYNEFAGTTAGVTPGWHSLGGSLTSGVGAGSAPDGSTAVLVLGPNGRIYLRTGTWPALGNWTRLF